VVVDASEWDGNSVEAASGAVSLYRFSRLGVLSGELLVVVHETVVAFEFNGESCEGWLILPTSLPRTLPPVVGVI
jgi:hypothetical protein